MDNENRAHQFNFFLVSILSYLSASIGLVSHNFSSCSSIISKEVLILSSPNRCLVFLSICPYTNVVVVEDSSVPKRSSKTFVRTRLSATQQLRSKPMRKYNRYCLRLWLLHIHSRCSTGISLSLYCYQSISKSAPINKLRVSPTNLCPNPC